MSLTSVAWNHGVPGVYGSTGRNLARPVNRLRTTCRTDQRLSVKCPNSRGHLGSLFCCLLLLCPPCALRGGDPCAAFCTHSVLPGRPARLASRAGCAVMIGKKVADCAKVGNFGVDRRDDVSCIHIISLRRLPLITKQRHPPKGKGATKDNPPRLGPGLHRSYCSNTRGWLTRHAHGLRLPSSRW